METNIEDQEPQNTPEGDPKPTEGGEEPPKNTEEGLTSEQIADLQKKTRGQGVPTPASIQEF